MTLSLLRPQWANEFGRRSSRGGSGGGAAAAGKTGGGPGPAAGAAAGAPAPHAGTGAESTAAPAASVAVAAGTTGAPTAGQPAGGTAPTAAAHTTQHQPSSSATGHQAQHQQHQTTLSADTLAQPAVPFQTAAGASLRTHTAAAAAPAGPEQALAAADDMASSFDPYQQYSSLLYDSPYGGGITTSIAPSVSSFSALLAEGLQQHPTPPLLGAPEVSQPVPEHQASAPAAVPAANMGGAAGTSAAPAASGGGGGGGDGGDPMDEGSQGLPESFLLALLLPDRRSSVPPDPGPHGGALGGGADALGDGSGAVSAPPVQPGQPQPDADLVQEGWQQAGEAGHPEAAPQQDGAGRAHCGTSAGCGTPPSCDMSQSPSPQQPSGPMDMGPWGGAVGGGGGAHGVGEGRSSKAVGSLPTGQECIRLERTAAAAAVVATAAAAQSDASSGSSSPAGGGEAGGGHGGGGRGQASCLLVDGLGGGGAEAGVAAGGDAMQTDASPSTAADSPCVGQGAGAAAVGPAGSRNGNISGDSKASPGAGQYPQARQQQQHHYQQQQQQDPRMPRQQHCHQQPQQTDRQQPWHAIQAPQLQSPQQHQIGATSPWAAAAAVPTNAMNTAGVAADPNGTNLAPGPESGPRNTPGITHSPVGDTYGNAAGAAAAGAGAAAAAGLVRSGGSDGSGGGSGGGGAAPGAAKRVGPLGGLLAELQLSQQRAAARGTRGPQGLARLSSGGGGGSSSGGGGGAGGAGGSGGGGVWEVAARAAGDPAVAALTAALAPQGEGARGGLGGVRAPGLPPQPPQPQQQQPRHQATPALAPVPGQGHLQGQRQQQQQQQQQPAAYPLVISDLSHLTHLVSSLPLMSQQAQQPSPSAALPHGAQPYSSRQITTAAAGPLLPLPQPPTDPGATPQAAWQQQYGQQQQQQAEWLRDADRSVPAGFGGAGDVGGSAGGTHQSWPHGQDPGSGLVHGQGDREQGVAGRIVQEGAMGGEALGEAGEQAGDALVRVPSGLSLQGLPSDAGLLLSELSFTPFAASEAAAWLQEQGGS